MSRIRPSTSKPFRPHKDAVVRFRSAADIARFVTRQSNLYPPQKREFLGIAVWKTTECHGKYTTRYRSIGAVTDPIGTPINHEHVLQRRYLIDRMIEHPTKTKGILELAVGCVVTRDEHDLLSPFDSSHAGWGRYIKAGIRVMDMLTMENLDLEAAAAEQIEALTELLGDASLPQSPISDS